MNISNLQSVAYRTVSLLLAVSTLITLGFWQIERGRQKDISNDAYLNRNNFSSRPLSDVLNEGGNPAWEKVYVTGRFSNLNIFLDNSINEKKFGYQVITPFIYGNDAILVVRGWVQGSTRRSVLPNISNSSSIKKIKGYLNVPPFTGISGVFDKGLIEFFGEDKIRIQKIDRITLEEIINIKLKKPVLYLEEGQPDAYLVKQKNLTRRHKHYAYAVQWFSMAFVLFLIGIINIRKKITYEPKDTVKK